ncbi:MAG: hypothetical protein HYT89_04445, partial [Candidatus Omnitrophica bacterium]|nr:hypothetical protein [Candidatus Omnitrophota bacterium]
MLRTHTCGELTEKNIGNKVTLCGWVDTVRDHGGLVFLDLRDRYGKTQIIFSGRVTDYKSEDCLQVIGTVQARPKGTENPKISTGNIEISVATIDRLSASEPLPFEVTKSQETHEDLRLKYRYLDLRNPAVQKNLFLRHRVCQVIRNFLDKEHFIEVETPILTKSTPEGARDYLVPSRVNPGEFFALPQSPQLFKQILMVAGFDRYFQIAKCFRDEDLRADRQPEFTQLDMEMSFLEEDDLFAVAEGVLKDILKQAWGNRLWKLEGSQYRMLAPGEAMEWFNAKGRRTRPLHARKDPSGYPKMRPFRSAYYREEIRKRYGKFHPAFIERKEAEIKWLERHAAELKKQLPAFNVQPKTIKDILGLNEKIARYYTTLKLLYQARMKRLDSKKQFIHYDEKMPQRVKEALIRNIEPEEAATALDWSRKYKTYIRAMTRVDASTFSISLTGLRAGLNSYFVDVTDDEGDSATTETRSFTVPLPSAEFVSPTPEDGASLEDVFEVTVSVEGSEPLSSAVLSWNGADFTMIESDSTHFSYTVSGLVPGEHSYFVEVVDDEGRH